MPMLSPSPWCRCPTPSPRATTQGDDDALAVDGRPAPTDPRAELSTGRAAGRRPGECRGLAPSSPLYASLSDLRFWGITRPLVFAFSALLLSRTLTGLSRTLKAAVHSLSLQLSHSTLTGLHKEPVRV